MNFTRDPIIESVISPKEGFKLLVRPSARDSEEEYTVDALEIVSFGNSHFFRSLEKPKAFLLPAGDYEVVEVKETRVVLKKANIEKPIKIAGGKKTSKETAQPKQQEEEKEKAEENKQEKQSDKEEKTEPKKGRRKKRGKETKKRQSVEEQSKKEETEKRPERKMRTLLPPPNSLISETITKYKEGEENEGSTTGTPFDDESHSQEASTQSTLSSVSAQEESESSQKAHELERNDEPPSENGPSTEEENIPHYSEDDANDRVSEDNTDMYSSEHFHPEYEEGQHSGNT